MLSQNEEGKQTRNYYLELERLYIEFLQNYFEKSRNQEEKIETLIKENNDLRTQISYRKNMKYEKKKGIYIMGYNEIKDVYKIGYTNNINIRRSADTVCPYDIKVFHFEEIECNGEVESLLHYILKSYRIKQYKEWFKFDNLTILKNIVINICQYIKETINKLNDHIEIPKLSGNDINIIENTIKGLVNKVDIEKIPKDEIKFDEEQKHPIINTLNDNDNPYCKSIITCGKNKGKQCPNHHLKNEQYCGLHIKYHKKNVNISDNNNDEKDNRIRKCPKCNEIKNISEFGKNPARHCGVNSYCRPCSNEKGRQLHNTHRRYEREFKECNKCHETKNIKLFFNYEENASKDCIDCITNTIENNPDTGEYTGIAKKCEKCNEILGIKLYHHNTNNEDGYNTMCNSCIKNITGYKKDEHQNQMKTCSYCDKTLYITDFFRTKDGPDKRYVMCKTCRKEKYGK